MGDQENIDGILPVHIERSSAPDDLGISDPPLPDSAERASGVYQFTLRQNFVVITVAAVTFALMRVISGYGLLLPCIWLFAAKCCPANIKRWKFALVTAFMGSGLLLHCWSSLAAYETLGDVSSQFLRAALYLHVAPFACCALGRLRSAIGISLVLTVLVAPWSHFVWQRQLVQLKGEVSRIACYAETVKGITGMYPADLSEYCPADEVLMQKIRYDCSNNHIMIYYWAGNDGAPHWYSATNEWGYDDD